MKERVNTLTVIEKIKLKRLFYISFLLYSVFTTASFNALGQIVQPNLPMICVGSASEYKVGSFYHGLADFKWRIYHTYNNDQDTLFVKPADITLFSRGDSIKVLWNEANNYEGGFYTLEVTETTDFGCEGVAYKQDVLLNTNTIYLPFEGVPSTVEACLGETATLDPGVFHNYFWKDGTTNRTYLTTVEGTYMVRLVDNNQSCSYDTIQAIFHSLPNVWLGNDTVLFGNQRLELNVDNPDFTAYHWNDNGTNLSETSSSLWVDGQSGKRKITVEVTDQNGCKNTDDINIGAADYSKLEIPSVFTPNGDGVNDKWYFPKPIGNQDVFTYFDDIEVKVFNRSGTMVWESSTSFIAWDGSDLKGRALPMDSYHYIIRFKIAGKTYVKKGSITIIR